MNEMTIEYLKRTAVNGGVIKNAEIDRSLKNIEVIKIYADVKIKPQTEYINFIFNNSEISEGEE